MTDHTMTLPIIKPLDEGFEAYCPPCGMTIQAAKFTDALADHRSHVEWAKARELRERTNEAMAIHAAWGHDS